MGQAPAWHSGQMRRPCLHGPSPHLPSSLPPPSPSPLHRPPPHNSPSTAVGSPTTAIQARDLNGDGRLDLVVSGGQSVFVLTGQGDGRFEVTWSGAAGENPVDLAIADLDGDG